MACTVDCKEHRRKAATYKRTSKARRTFTLRKTAHGEKCFWHAGGIAITVSVQFEDTTRQLIILYSKTGHANAEEPPAAIAS